MFCIIVCFLFISPIFLHAQMAAEMETILETPIITCGEAARFVLLSAEVTEDNGSAVTETAFDWAMKQGWLSKRSALNDYITLGNLSLLVMNAFGFKGGLMYTLFPIPRYAFRTMVSRSVIQGAADPDMTVSGERLCIRPCGVKVRKNR